MGRRVSTRAGICCVVLVLLASSAPAGSAAQTQSSGTPEGQSVNDFISRTRTKRTAIARQASGCQSAPDEAACRAFRPASADEAPSYDPDRVVVKVAPRASASALANAHASRVLGSIGRTRSVVLDVPKGSSVPSFIAALRKNPAVEYAEPNNRLQAFADPPQQVDWGVRAVKALEATSTNGVTGDGVKVAVVDSGVDYTHPDLDDNISVNTLEDGNTNGRFDPNDPLDNNGVDDDGNGFIDDVVGYDFNGRFFTSKEPDNDPMDVLGHGTHVAGTIAAEDNSVGVRGVAPDATILPVRVLDDGGGGFDSEIADGIYYAVDNGADIINMSLGGYGLSSAMREAVEYADDNGVSVVAAAGNAFFYALPSFPAAYPSVLSVAAARDEDRTSDTELLTKVWWSDWGHSDFLAPGEGVLSTTPDNTYDTFSGTSMASPHVAGALALVREEFVDSALAPTPAKLEQALSAGAVDVHFPGKDEVSGSGVPDAQAATTIVEANDQVELYRDRYLIPSDGATGSTITVRLLQGDGDPIVGETVNWATDKGTLLVGAGLTDANGETSTVLTVQGDYGSATVTADPAAHPARDIRVIVEDDRVRVDDAYLMPPIEDEDEFEDFDTAQFGPGALDAVIPRPGQAVVMRAYIGQHDLRFNDDRVSAVDWVVEDPDGDPVPSLSGALDPLTVPAAWFYFENPYFESEPMTIPFDAETGRYHLSVTATMEQTGETHTFEKDFFVGTNSADVLIVNHHTSVDVETLNMFVFHQNDSAVRRALEGSGKSFTFWDPDVHGFFVPQEVLDAHPVVIWLGGWDGTLDWDIDMLGSYVASGGNLILSGEQFATFARFNTASTQFRDIFSASGLLSTFFPDDNHQQNPQSVTFANTSFDALDPLTGTYDLGAYDLNHSGESTAIFTDEMKLFDGRGAQTLAAHPTGVNAAGGFEAGTVLDNGSSRVIALGFGLEAINDGTSPQTLSDAVGALLDFLAPAPVITRVKPRRVDNSGQSSFKIKGSGFQRLGATSVRLDSKRIGARRVAVLDHARIKVRIPKGFKPGKYDVTVTNPDGQTTTLVNAIRVLSAQP